MRGIGTWLFVVAVVAAVISPTPSAALGLRIGPFHFGLPFFPPPQRFSVPRHRIALRAPIREEGRAPDEANLGPVAPTQSGDLAPLYPSLALPDLYNDIFWPQLSARWPFTYDAIFSSAFAKSFPGPQTGCRQDNQTAATIERIGREIGVKPAQKAALQKLGGALAAASGALAKACPKTIPPDPVARLQLVQSQIEVLTFAIDLVRPPLQQFEQSLDPRQRTRFAEAPTASDDAAACGSAPTSIDWSVHEIDRSVQPNDAQRSTLAQLRKTLGAAVGDLDTQCPKSLPADPLARVEAIEARLDASWRVGLAMQVALAAFESRLDNQQRNRLAAIDPADAR